MVDALWNRDCHRGSIFSKGCSRYGILRRTAGSHRSVPPASMGQCFDGHGLWRCADWLRNLDCPEIRGLTTEYGKDFHSTTRTATARKKRPVERRPRPAP